MCDFHRKSRKSQPNQDWPPFARCFAAAHGNDGTISLGSRRSEDTPEGLPNPRPHRTHRSAASGVAPGIQRGRERKGKERRSRAVGVQGREGASPATGVLLQQPLSPASCTQAGARNLLSPPDGRPPLLLCFVAAGTLTDCSPPLVGARAGGAAARCLAVSCTWAFANGRPARSRSSPGGLLRPCSRLLRIFPPPLLSICLCY